MFDGDSQSSDGGLLLLGTIDRRLRLTDRLAACLTDERDPLKVDHTYTELFRQRVFAVAAGYEDAHDAARTAADPVLKEACGRRAIEGAALASQPTISRFERAQSGRDLVRLARQLEEIVIRRHRKRLGRGVRRVTIDLDPTDDPTHGQQPFSFFNGHYDTHCYLPIFGFLTFDDEPEQHLFLARLRPGNATASRTTRTTLRRVIPLLREAFPKAKIRVRLDGGFANPENLDLLDDMADEYVVGLPGNSRLDEIAEPLMVDARIASEAAGETARFYDEVDYAAKTWSRSRRIVVKAEVTRLEKREPKDNPRFVVTKLPRKDPEQSYDVYCGRGEIENRLKELHHGLGVDRTSCTEFLANQLRVLIAATAYVLFQELRFAARATDLARAQVSTLRERLLKIGARVIESVRRIVLHFPAAYPWAQSWRLIARAVGAT